MKNNIKKIIRSNFFIFFQFFLGGFFLFTNTHIAHARMRGPLEAG